MSGGLRRVRVRVRVRVRMRGRGRRGRQLSARQQLRDVRFRVSYHGRDQLRSLLRRLGRPSVGIIYSMIYMNLICIKKKKKKKKLRREMTKI